MFLSFLATDPNQRRGGTNRKGEDGVCKSVITAVSIDVNVNVGVRARVFFLQEFRGVPGRRPLYSDSVHVLGDQVDRHSDGLALFLV